MFKCKWSLGELMRWGAFNLVWWDHKRDRSDKTRMVRHTIWNDFKYNYYYNTAEHTDLVAWIHNHNPPFFQEVITVCKIPFALALRYLWISHQCINQTKYGWLFIWSRNFWVADFFCSALPYKSNNASQVNFWGELSFK